MLILVQDNAKGKEQGKHNCHSSNLAIYASEEPQLGQVISGEDSVRVIRVENNRVCDVLIWTTQIKSSLLALI